MQKVKTEEEYDKHLLPKKTSKRDRRDEPGFTLLPAPPPWADKEHLWDERRYNRSIEGWEKLCMEAYFSGWIDYFDINVQHGDHTIYFEWTELKTEKDEKIDKDIKTLTIVRIYLNPSPSQAIAPAPVLVDKPPPPPMS